MKKTVMIVAAAFLLFGQPANAAEAYPEISAKSAIVYHADDERVLYEKNAEAKMLIASTTKILTALVAIEHCSLSDSVKITQDMANVEGSSMYLQAGESYTVQELLYGLMLASGNDAATAIAIHVAGDEVSFAALMNQKAAELGMEDSCFENPHGLDSQNHYSTAKDMAILASYAMENELFAEIVGTRHITIKNLTYVNHNKLLWQCDGVIGIKTGYTMAAGRTLVTCCRRNGQTLICVTLSARDDWNDHKKLYDWAYGAYQERLVLEKNTRFRVPIVTGNDDMVSVEPLTDVTVFVDEDDAVAYRVELPRFVFGPVNRGDTAGQIVVTVNGRDVSKVPLVFMEDYKMNIDNPSAMGYLIRKIRGT